MMERTQLIRNRVILGLSGVKRGLVTVKKMS